MPAAGLRGGEMKIRGSILVADDEAKIVRAIERALRDEGHEVVSTTDPLQARQWLGERSFDVLLVDNVMPELSGLELMRDVVTRMPSGQRPQILMMTAHPSVEDAIEAMKLGAVDYLRKPFDLDDLLAATSRALTARHLEIVGPDATGRRAEDAGNCGIVGESRCIRDVIRQARLVAASKSTVLITGETGTGKEMIARAIHMHSERRTRPLVRVNSAAIPDNLIESELFGYVRGAFTGAFASRRGKFAMADGGSIFLDEIGTLSPSVQPKILRVLQEREFEPLGSERTERVDVRVITATNRDLSRMVSEGKFLEDLYYRLNVIPLHIPPLRERTEDIPILARHFVQKHQQLAGKKVERIDEAAMECLMRHHWPGNVRELENTIERAVVLANGPVLSPVCVSIAQDLATDQASLPSMTLHSNVDWVEKETIKRAMRATRGVKKDAADLMGISQRALTYYLTKHNIE
jgi:two-component system, NtrC family, response regulator AtoC